MVNADGGLTTAGYAVCIAVGVALFGLAIFFAGKSSEKKKMSAKQLVFCAMAVALAFITSYLKIFHLPWGGSVTLCSMLFIVLTANWYGPKTGVMVGLAYGILQFIQEPYVLSFFQVCCDYVLAFAALGVAGFFAKSSHGLVKGYIAAVIARGAFHALGGYLYWMSYMPENFPQSLKAVYPIVYNYSFLLAEGVITVIIISIPAVARALAQVKKSSSGVKVYTFKDDRQVFSQCTLILRKNLFLTGAYTKEKLQSQENTDEGIFWVHKTAIRKVERRILWTV